MFSSWSLESQTARLGHKDSLTGNCSTCYIIAQHIEYMTLSIHFSSGNVGGGYARQNGKLESKKYFV